jgi:hypothetical protein
MKPLVTDALRVCLRPTGRCAPGRRRWRGRGTASSPVRRPFPPGRTGGPSILDARPPVVASIGGGYAPNHALALASKEDPGGVGLALALRRRGGVAPAERLVAPASRVTAVSAPLSPCSLPRPGSGSREPLRGQAGQSGRWSGCPCPLLSLRRRGDAREWGTRRRTLTLARAPAARDYTNPAIVSRSSSRY